MPPHYLKRAAALLTENVSLKDIATRHPEGFLKYHCGIERMRQLVQAKPPNPRPIEVTVLWGSTGTGKTHRARTAYPGGYTIRAGRAPFDQYDGQKVVFFEEFCDKDWPIADMLMYLDKWECPLNCRYQNKYAAWEKVIILTNLDPVCFYNYEDNARVDAFRRRLSRIIQVKNQEETIDL